MSTCASREGNEPISQLGSWPFSFCIPAHFLPILNTVKPSQMKISSWTALSKCSSVQSGQPSLLQVWSGARSQGYELSSFPLV